MGYPEELDKFLMGVKDKPGALDIDVATEDGWTCLHDMITHECQFTHVARVLIKHGANVNTSDLNGDSPLHSALLYHNTDNIKLLLEGMQCTITVTLYSCAHSFPHNLKNHELYHKESG